MKYRLRNTSAHFISRRSKPRGSGTRDVYDAPDK